MYFQPVSDIPQVCFCFLRGIQDALDFPGLCSVLARGGSLTTRQVSCLSRPDQAEMAHAQSNAIYCSYKSPLVIQKMFLHLFLCFEQFPESGS